MSSTEFIELLKKEDLIIVSKKQLLDLMIEVNVKSAVDKRVKWIDRRTAIAKYAVTKYWLMDAEKDVYSLVKHKTERGRKKYLEQTIIDEQLRQSQC